MEKAKFKIHSIKYNFVMNVILKISAFIFPLITFPYTSRVLGAAANGKIAFASSVVTYFGLIASMGIPSYGVRKCAEVRDDIQKLQKITGELLAINSVFMLLSYAAFVLMVLVVPKFKDNTLLMMISSLTIIFSTFGVEWFYQAIEQYSYITVRNIIFKIIGIIFMFIFVHKVEDYIIYAGINVFATVGSNVLNIIRLRKFIKIGQIKLDRSSFMLHIVPIVTLFLYNAATMFFTNLDQVMLGFMVDDYSVGYYNAAIKIKNMLVSVITALGAVMLPRVSYFLKQGKTKEFHELIIKSFEFIFISAIPIAVFLTAKAASAIIILAGTSYMPSIYVLQLLMPSIIFIGFGSVTAWQLLIPLGREKYTVYGAVAGAVVDLIINLLLIPQFGERGAAIGTSIAEMAVFTVHVIGLKDIIKGTFEFRDLAKTVICSLAALAAIIAFDMLYPIKNLLWDCIIAGIIYFAVYGALLITTKEKLAVNILEGLKSR